MSKILCAKHYAEFQAYAMFGPGNPSPPGLTMAMIDSQIAGIKSICESNSNCSVDTEFAPDNVDVDYGA